MELNKKKSHGMIFNFSNEYKFTSQIQIESEVTEIVSQTQLLGVMMNNTLTWNANTLYLVKRANSRPRLLHKLVSFSVPVDDLVSIYTYST